MKKLEKRRKPARPLFSENCDALRALGVAGDSVTFGVHDDLLEFADSDGGIVAIPASRVDRMRHRLVKEFTAGSYLIFYELRIWWDGRPTPVLIRYLIGDAGKAEGAIRRFATQVVALVGVDRLETGGLATKAWVRSTLAILLFTAFTIPLVHVAFTVRDSWIGLIMLPFLAFVIWHYMEGHWPPRRARSLESFLALVPRL